MSNYITAIDVVLILVYALIILGFGSAYSKKLGTKQLQKYFMRGLAFKLLCGLGFGWVYVYYYGGGDTQMYYEGAQIVFENVTSGGGLQSVFSTEGLPYGSAATLFTQRFAGAVNLLSFNSYWSCTLVFATLSFMGLWLLFLSFYKQFPELHKRLATVCLFVPGVVFWSAGIMKDSICMLFIGVLIYGIQNIFLYNKSKIYNAFLVIVGFYVILSIKTYIALALIVAIAFYAILTLKARIKSKATQVLIVPFAALVLVAGAVLLMRQIGESLEKYALENLVETAQSYQGYHARTSIAGRGSSVRTGSSYSLGDIDFSSPLSIASKFPLAVNVTFFRPYIWEAKNPVMLLSALESMLVLLFTIQVMRRSGIKRFFGAIVSDKEIIFCFTFAIIFGFAVGFTTYNFGSLVRYKTPCIPFFLIGLTLINRKYHADSLPKRPSGPRGSRGRHIVPKTLVQS